MSVNRPCVRLGDYCLKIGSGATPKGGANVYLTSGDISLIRSQNIYNAGFRPEGLVYITADHADKLSNVAVQIDDILLNITGDSVARVCLAPQEFLPARVNQHVAIIRPDPKEFDARFLRYFLASSSQQNHLLTLASAGATRNALTKANIETLDVYKPSMVIQKWIADQLESLDKKIGINNRINQTLEQMAQTLFKSWFIDFEPVKVKIAVLEAGGSQENATLAAMTAISGKNADALAIFEREHPEQYAELKATAELFPSAMQESELGEIPEGWTIDNLGTIIEFNPKRILKKGINAPYLDMKNVPVKGHSVQEVVCREVTSGTKFKNGDTLLARITPCLENGKTAFVDFLSSNDTVGWGSTEFIVMRVKRDLPLSLSYFIARLESFRITAIQSMQGTSGRQRADAAVLQNMPWVIPPDALLVKFGKFSNFVIDNNRVKHNQNTQLSQLRDTLLPKLLSGEITLPEAEELAKEADYV